MIVFLDTGVLGLAETAEASHLAEGQEREH
jgi:hypothetical protein